ncbi:hypothetical protein [Streptomyces collinus]|uniref:hypothetical protein n=1 Tax=Streptomyces collinus TaxID=42684 RepID=UPI003691AB00
MRAYDQNLCTECHSRYDGRGVLIYWHVEKKSPGDSLPADRLHRLQGHRDGQGRHAAWHRWTSRPTTRDRMGSQKLGSASPGC